MDPLWFVETLNKLINEKKSDLENLIMNGAKDYDEYNYLRGRYNSLEDVESEIRELLKRVGENDEQGIST
jgi:predicted  nucleic acid-binding Zn-ribbon protein|tara:strand:+ start:211 stop:420 length:210 start_codon:yes stop_codon:yes gene_type:complete